MDLLQTHLLHLKSHRMDLLLVKSKFWGLALQMEEAPHDI